MYAQIYRENEKGVGILCVLGLRAREGGSYRLPETVNLIIREQTG